MAFSCAMHMGNESSSRSEMQSMRSSRQLRVWASVLITLQLVVAQAAAQHTVEAETDILHLASDIYNVGPLEVDLFTVPSATGLSQAVRREMSSSHPNNKYGDSLAEIEVAATGPPRPLLIATPKKAGKYPVIAFQHGFSLQNSFYSQLMTHVASYGFIVVAPQMYTLITGADATDEICAAAKVIDWFRTGLEQALSARASAVRPDLGKVAIAGHSRGGKVAFGVATGVCKTALSLSAIAALDPVDGPADGQQSKPPILKFSPHALKLPFPTLIVGAERGAQKRSPVLPACAPDGVSHAAFYSDSDSPAFHFVAPDYGHMDYMDDTTGGVQGLVSYLICVNGASREPMRRFSAGVLVAFFQATLLGDSAQLRAAVANPSAAPVTLRRPETYGALSRFVAETTSRAGVAAA